MVRETPLGHDRTAARNDAGHAVGGHRHVAQQHTGVDGEVIDALLGLLDQRVAEHFPGQLFGLAVDLFQRLVDRHGTDRHRRIADDPLARFVDVLAGRQIHHGVAAPADRPGHFLDFFLDAGTERGVADVGVDLHQEVAADDHRLGFRVVDVVGDDGAAARDFAAHEFGRDLVLQAGTEVLARMLAVHQRGELGAHRAGLVQAFQIGRTVVVLADGDELHLRRDDALARVMHLRDIRARLGAARRAVQVGKTHRRQFRIGRLLTAIFRTQVGQNLGIAARFDPAGTQRRQALANVDLRRRVGVGTRTVVDEYRRIFLAAHAGGRIVLGDFTHRHLDVGLAARHVNLARIGQGLHSQFIDMCVGGKKWGSFGGDSGVHDGTPEKQEASDAPRWE